MGHRGPTEGQEGGRAMRDDNSNYPRSGTQKARDETILRVLRRADDPYLSTSEVAEELPIGQRATHNRLEDLAERGVIKKKSVGAGNIWRTQTDEVAESQTNAASGEPVSGSVNGHRQSPFITFQTKWSTVITIGVIAFASSALLLLFTITMTVNGIPLLFVDLGLILLAAVGLAILGLFSFILVGVRAVLKQSGVL